MDARFSAAARTAALGIVLARAGLSLDVKAVYRLRWAIKRLAFGPATAEALVVTLLAKPALGLPWSHCAALGYLFAGISPAVVVPSMLALQDHGRGVRAGVPALAITAASVDVVYAIAGFGVVSSWLPGMGAGGATAAAWRRHADRRRRAGRVGRREAPRTVLPPRERARYEHDNVDAENERAADERASDAWRHAVFGGDGGGNGRRIRPRAARRRLLVLGARRRAHGACAARALRRRAVGVVGWRGVALWS